MSVNAFDVVGRGAEIAALAAWFADRRALPAAFAIEGEAGMGKTVLLRRGFELATEASYRVLRTSPTEMEGRLSFAGLGDMLDPVVDRVLDALPEPQRRSLAVALLREGIDGSPPDPRAVALAFLDAVRSLAASGPLAIIVDDIQWLDAPTLFTLTFATRRLRDEPVAILYGLRSGGDPTSAVDALLPEGRTRRLQLSAFSLAEIQRLLDTRLGLDLTRLELGRLRVLSGGNPFFALELGRAIERGSVRLEAGAPLPRSLTLLVDDRLRSLPAESRAPLLAAAVVSQPTLPLIRTMLGDGSTAGLKPAHDQHVIELDGDRIMFSHPLLASAAYAAADQEDRAAAHRRAAAAVVDEEERARHLALAAAGPDALVADTLETAARHAGRRGALTSASELADAARRLTPPSDLEARLRRTVHSAGYAFDLGDIASSRALIEAVLIEAPSGRGRAEALYWLGRNHHYEGDRRIAVKLYREGLAVSEDDVALQVHLHDALADALLLQRIDLEAAAEHARTAVALAEEMTDPSHLVEALATLGLVEILLGRPGWREHLARAVVLEGDADLVSRAGWSAAEPPVDRGSNINERSRAAPLTVGPWIFPALAAFNLAVALTWADEVEAALSILRELRRRSEERAQDSALPWTLAQLSIGEYLVGRWDEATRLADEAIEIAAQVGQESQGLFARGIRALIDASQGRTEAARADANHVLERADERGIMVAAILASTALGVLELSLGQHAAAHAALGDLLDRLEAGGVREPGSARFVGDDIEALIGLGRLADATAMLERLEERASALNRRSAIAVAARCRGLLLAARGELEAALGSLEGALVPGAGTLFEDARTLMALGRVRRRAKMKRAAREALASAAATFERLGARIWAEAARQDIERIGGRRPASGDLTPTELRIVELVAEGRTDREVAEVLYVTPKTVSTQLSRIYRKVGVSSRTSLAAWRIAAARGPKE